MAQFQTYAPINPVTIMQACHERRIFCASESAEMIANGLRDGRTFNKLAGTQGVSVVPHVGDDMFTVKDTRS